MDHYQPLPEITKSLTGKTLVMVIGPTAIGKSSLMNEVARIDYRFWHVGGFTTRGQRSNDEPGLYRYLSESEANQLIERQLAVQYVKHPTTQLLYGTEPHDYAAEFNMKDTLTTAVDDYRRLPFAHTVAISLTAEPNAWMRWLTGRFPTASEDRAKRLHESKQSLEWSLAQTKNHQWLLNQPGDLTATAKQFVAMIDGASADGRTPQIPIKLLAYINDLL